MDKNIHLGSKIRKYRHLAGMTQEELAEYSNLSVNYISKIEREKKQNVSIEKLVDICNALNISVEEILDSKHNLSIKNLPPNAIELITYLRDSDSSNIDEICEQLLLLLKKMEK